ncbi:hypothetical protein RVW73_002530 [Enterobacter asburiae]|nr:hypothetical protein [Enterobacter asburiae]
MPYKHTLSEMMMLLFTNPPEAARIIAMMGLGGIARACLNSSRGFLKRIGDISCCVLMFYCIKPFIPVMPTICGVQVPRGTIAIAISMAGSHVIYALFIFIVKRRTGVDLKEVSKDG